MQQPKSNYITIDLRNQIRRLTRKGKKLYEEKIARNVKSNPKAFWRYTQSKLKSRSCIPDLAKPGSEHNPEYAKTDGEKAEIFLNYFSSVFTVEPENSELPDFNKRNFQHELQNKDITQEQIVKKLKKLKINKSPGPDAIHPRVVNELASALAEPLSIIFNTSVRTMELPLEWKHANISAIFKKGSRTSPQNYRPVSLTSIICKTLESLIRDSVIDHMVENNLFSQQQFGFITGRSTVLQLLHVLNIWTEIIDQGGRLEAVYCDFMKAFDKVPHRRLIHKIEKYGITNNILGWIKSFLSNRTQCVSVNEARSASAAVTSGIPQGSVLGPILFVIYINDLPDIVDKDSYIYLFADDTKVFREIKFPQDKEILQVDIDNLVNWSDTWLLKFHPDKCKVMSIGHKSTVDDSELYKMGAHNLDYSENEKDLGVYIDNKLTFESHINNAVNKANRIMAIARKTYDYMDAKTFSYIFKGLVRPHLEYAASVWSPHTIKLKEIIENYLSKKLFIKGCNKDLRKYAFSMRSARIWNSLPVETINATDVKNFERALDRHWEDQELLFDNFKAEITLKSSYNT